MRYDFPKNYQSYVQCKSRARAIDALHVLLIPAEGSKDCVWQLAQYHYIEKVLKQISRQRISSIDIFFFKSSNLSQILLLKCSNNEPSEEDENEADLYATMIPHYQPLASEDAPKVSFNSAISLVNRYLSCKYKKLTIFKLLLSTILKLFSDTVQSCLAIRLPV